jgi:hypothetical protein
MLHIRGVRTILRLLTVISATFLTLGLLAACGSSGTDSGASDVRSLGEIEALGSIIVNGVKYETEGAQIIGLDNPNEDLKPGRIVLVDGRVNDDSKTGTASRIKIEDSVKGPLTSVDDEGTIKVGTVMGQTVIFEDNLTKFDPDTGLPTGDDLNKVFVVSGFERDDSKIQATFARKISNDDFSGFLANGGILEVKGTVRDLNPAEQTFKINGLTINYSTANLRDLPGGILQNGLLVEVKGNAFNADTHTLSATEVEGKSIRMGDDIARAEAEGFISNLNAGARTFSVNGQSVDYSKTSFRAGIEADLADGIKVEVQGPLSNGVIQATRVTFKESVRIEADVATVDAAARTITLQGLPGISIVVHPELTRGASDLSQLGAGNEVKIRARQAASGLIATRLERIDSSPGGQTILQGPVTDFSAAANTVTLLETVEVNTSTINNEDFKDHDRVIGRTVFFQSLQTGDIVKARFRNGAWDQIEFQD